MWKIVEADVSQIEQHADTIITKTAVSVQEPRGTFYCANSMILTTLL